MDMFIIQIDISNTLSFIISVDTGSPVISAPIWSPTAELTPRKLKLKTCTSRLRVQVSRLKKKNIMKAKNFDSLPKDNTYISVDKLIKALDHHLDGPSLEFVSAQLRLSKTSNHGRRWTVQDKSFALSILHTSPQAYRIFSKAFIIPSVKTLRRSVKKLKIYPGFNRNLLNTFKVKVNSMSPESKLCCIVFDEMSLKEGVSYNSERDEVEGLEDFGYIGRSSFVDNHALVFMLRGLTSKWKQPIGYFLSNSTVSSGMLKSLMEQCITEACDLD